MSPHHVKWDTRLSKSSGSAPMITKMAAASATAQYLCHEKDTSTPSPTAVATASATMVAAPSHASPAATPMLTPTDSAPDTATAPSAHRRYATSLPALTIS